MVHRSVVLRVDHWELQKVPRRVLRRVQQWVEHWAHHLELQMEYK
jgi:hypothetical protein